MRYFHSSLLLIPAVLLLLAFGSGREAGGESFTAIYRGDHLALSIPYHAVHAGSGMLVTEILSPEDDVLGRTERRESTMAGDGVWKENIQKTASMPLEDLVWQRIRYSFRYNGEQANAFELTRSISEILRRPAIHLLAQSSYLAGTEAAIRVIVSDSENREIAGRSSVRMEVLVPDQPSRLLFEGRLNQRGTAEAQFRFPAGFTGNYKLHLVADTPIGSAEISQPLRLENRVSILLTTEKRMYQPGQTIHARTLVLDQSNHHSAAGEKLTFEILDPHGNKVFKKAAATDEYGIAATEFTLADEVNLGTYQLHALMGDAAHPSTTTELALSVDRYVLPKFKVAIDFTAKDGKPKRDYRPGDHVTGTVQANYFFGKPVDHSEISVKASSMDVQLVETAASHGRTDKDGTYKFDLQLPSFLAGVPLNKGAAPVLIEASVKDGSGHAEAHSEDVTVSESALLVTAIPEGGALIPGLENQVFLLASYADGSPAKVELQVSSSQTGEQEVTTDARGVAAIRLKPAFRNESLKVNADDRHGNKASTVIQLQSRSGADQILLRPDRAIYKAGDGMAIQVFSTAKQGSAYLDIVKDGQTILTRDLDITNGFGEVTLTATPDMSGTLNLNVYRFGQNGQALADHRLVFVQPAEELRIQAVSNLPVYKPGADAEIQFKVTNEHGEGVSAALGLQVVDEAVFALADKQPGFAKIFFYLEQELLKPRYEIHSLSIPEMIEPTADFGQGQNDQAAQALLSGVNIAQPKFVNFTSQTDVSQSKQQEYRSLYREAFQQHAADLAGRFSNALARTSMERRQTNLAELVTESDGSSPKDAWGTELRIEPVSGNGLINYYRIQSAGADRRFDTPDDLNVNFEARTGNILGMRMQQSIQFKINHERGAFNGLATIAGTITDRSGAGIAKAAVTLRQPGVSGNRRAVTGPDGSFNFGGLRPGSYSVEISAKGFERATGRVTLEPRDLAEITQALNVGMMMQTFAVDGIEIEGMAAQVQNLTAQFAFSDRKLEALPLPQAKAMALMAPTVRAAAVVASPPATEETHIRSYFPEALYINPEIITDREGRATIHIPMADSITTWRMAMLASTTTGSLGTASASLKVFQDFFVDLDLPVTLTQGDRISLPVAIYNYAGHGGDVTLSMEKDDWFALVDDSNEKNLSVESNHVGSSSFSLEAKRIGKFKLKISARMNGEVQRRDIVVREIEVVPNGREQNVVFNGQVETQAERTISFPNLSIPDASKIFVRLYPGPLSQVIEGMDAILRMPGGCFEQTSSSTYPNILALDYMKRTKKLSPEVHAKAEGYIANGYQRLLTFEVPGGGFSWFGQAPANKILTAYGLMEFHDMSKVHDVDEKLIERTADWLASQQQSDGSWKPDSSFINEGATNRYNSDVLRITAYIAWALEDSEYRGPATERARQFISSHLNAKGDSYTLAVVANFAVAHAAAMKSNADALSSRAIQMLLDAAVEKDEQISWNSEETGVYSTGVSAAIETTGLATQALLKWHASPATIRKALAYLASKKDASGTWGTTQATIMAMRALLMASDGIGDMQGTVQVSLNGKSVEKLELTHDNNDLFYQFVLPGVEAKKTNQVEIRFKGTGGLAYQVVGRYFVPWENQPAREPLSISVSYDRTSLAQNQFVDAVASITNNLNETANMVMVDLGIPPGFDLMSEDLEEFKEKSGSSPTGKLEKFSLTATQAILYFNGFAPGKSVKIHFRLRAKYPIRAQSFQSRVYEYYNPTVSSLARPQRLEVTER